MPVQLINTPIQSQRKARLWNGAKAGASGATLSVVEDLLGSGNSGHLLGCGAVEVTALALVGGLVLLVGHQVEPGGSVAIGDALQHGEVAHEIVVGGAVPVLLTGRCINGVAWASAKAQPMMILPITPNAASKPMHVSTAIAAIAVPIHHRRAGEGRRLIQPRIPHKTPSIRNQVSLKTRS